nr:MAG TPA: GYF domain [Caudoviricetes sp.]
MKTPKNVKWKYWLIEDGSVDVDELQQFIDENNLKIKIIVYRQGSIKPELKNF